MATSFLQNNLGTNYTLYFNVIDYFKTIMQNHPTIQSVSQGDISDIDVEQYQLYPLGNVNILSADFNANTTDYTIQLIVADKIKNKNNESVGRTNALDVPFYGDDDTVDIWANMLGVVNDLTAFTQYSVESFNINDQITNEPFAERFNNGLAGWVSTFTLTTHNDRPRCLYNLYDTPPFEVEISYVAVAGGGAGGGQAHGGGGGAGGYLTGFDTLLRNIVYPIVIGGGGTGTYFNQQPPSNGSNTTFNGLTLIGGGGGNSSSGSGNGAAGGSGGGAAPNGVGGVGTVGQGKNGGNGISNISGSYAGGGGGGASQTGSSATGTTQANVAAGNGGSGSNAFYNWVSNTSPYYAGGGGGGVYISIPNTGVVGIGGIGGGGTGGGHGPSGHYPTNGTVNTGGGGGGAGGWDELQTSGNGGSGIVIIQYAGLPRAIGGNILNTNGFTTHTFTASGNFQITS